MPEPKERLGSSSSSRIEVPQNSEYGVIYEKRLETLSGRVLNRLQKRELCAHQRSTTIDSFEGLKIVHLFEVKDQPCIVIGSLHRNLKCREDILRRFSHNLQVVFRPSELQFVANDEDQLFFEDGNQRIPVELAPELAEKYALNQKLSGVYPGAIVGIKCKHDSPNEEKITILDFILPGCLSQTYSLSKDDSCRALDQNKILIVSNLCFSLQEPNTHSSRHLSNLECLKQIIFGNIPSGNFLDGVKQLLIIGSSISGGDLKSQGDSKENIVSHKKIPQNLKLFEQFLISVCEHTCLSIKVVSGWNDPVSLFYPQSKFPSMIFPKLISKFGDRIEFAPNPTNSIDLLPSYPDLNILVSDGSNIQSIKTFLGHSDAACDPKSSNVLNDVEIMQNLLAHGHFMPMCPDIIPCVSEADNNDEDQLVIKEQPHLFISGSPFSTGATIQQLDCKEGRSILVVVPDYLCSPTLSVLNVGRATLDTLRIDY
ncbi:MAG: DNA polymerase delta subunit 2 [Marteilia pararefringens]